MSKLVNNPADAAVFLPRLLPGLDAVRKEVANPECREVADKAHATLLRVGAKGQVTTMSEEDKAAEAKVISLFPSPTETKSGQSQVPFIMILSISM